MRDLGPAGRRRIGGLGVGYLLLVIRATCGAVEKDGEIVVNLTAAIAVIIAISGIRSISYLRGRSDGLHL